MSPVKTRWGIVPFGISLAVIVAIFYVAIVFPAIKNPVIYTTALPISGIVLSLLLFLAGHFSYPRVQNLKVYLIGYLAGLCGIAYFVGVRSNPNTSQLLSFLLIIIAINYLIVLTLPSYVKYRYTRRITLAMAGVEALLFLLMVAVPSITSWTISFNRDTFFGGFSISAVVWLLIVAGLSIWRLRDEFFLGGILTGTAAIYALAWIAPSVIVQNQNFELLCFAASALTLNGGILFHWLSRMEHRVSYDPLLHIYNRNYCSKIISEQSNLNTKPPFGVAMIDIDHFKKVNDSYGHQAGDQVLYAIAQAISREVVPDGIVCRYGGEEMVVFFPKKNTKQISEVIEAVRETIEGTKVPTRRKKLSVTVSCGLSHRESTSQSIIDVIHAADKALYRAKKGGRNQIKTGKTPLPTAKKK